jgi:hypothetical protein
MTLDSTIVATLIAIGSGAVGSLIAWQIASAKSSHDLQLQDVRHSEAIHRLDLQLTDLKSDYRVDLNLLRESDRDLEKAIEESDRKFRSLVNFLALKGLHYRVRDDDKGTLS